jgi:hypothetical protein
MGNMAELVATVSVALLIVLLSARTIGYRGEQCNGGESVSQLPLIYKPFFIPALGNLRSWLPALGVRLLRAEPLRHLLQPGRGRRPSHLGLRRRRSEDAEGAYCGQGALEELRARYATAILAVSFRRYANAMRPRLPAARQKFGFLFEYTKESHSISKRHD